MSGPGGPGPHACLGFLVPIPLAFPLAEIGSSCDDLTEKLNELQVESDDGGQRVIPLQLNHAKFNHSLTHYPLSLSVELGFQATPIASLSDKFNLNCRQGLGVRLFKTSTVIDKPQLLQIATALNSLGSTLAVAQRTTTRRRYLFAQSIRHSGVRAVDSDDRAPDAHRRCERGLLL